MMSCNVRAIKSELFKVMKIVRKRATSKDQKELILVLFESVKTDFKVLDDLTLLANKLNHRADFIQSNLDLYDDYTSFILYSAFKRTTAALKGIDSIYNLTKTEEAKEHVKEIWLTCKEYTILNDKSHIKEYNEFVMKEEILMDNIAFHPMFLHVLKKDNKKLLLEFKPDKNNYIYGIIYDGYKNGGIMLTEANIERNWKMAYGRSVALGEFNDMYNSYIMFRISKTSYLAAKDIVESKSLIEFKSDYNYELSKSILGKNEIIKIAETYMRAVEKEKPVYVHLKAYTMGGFFVEKINNYNV